MCGHIHFFKEIRVVEDGHVSFGDASKIQVKGQGTISYMQEHGTKGLIENLYFVPDLKSSILSMGKLMEKGYSVFMKDQVLQFKDKKGWLVTQINMAKNRMYKINLVYVREKCLQVDVEDKASLWHFRFGHLYYGGLQKLLKNKMVYRLPEVDYTNKICEDCIFGKHARSSFQKKAEYRASHTLELVHTDICGPITPESFSGKRYFITFIDDYSRKTWVYFLKEKSETFNVFKKFKAMVEKTTGKFIIAL
ncbi:Retrovirus-related Pol polyprotein from transposon TNT 1-94 [Dendrobium catenatum]|uniref:Retrovirus-related Pol polyprotein from transposon TNT 1-94 n=1 Tax=Dendrobium catenatum TaxID=906689 RepID=A0A2I0WVZ5_9ASPA|nr:Retrovirus-related Pol polyprotein from transposon TNT 1-94 [Dendrobium catenatum]